MYYQHLCLMQVRIVKEWQEIIQGMRKSPPGYRYILRVEQLRSGDDWKQALWREIDKRDVLFLCWSEYARESKWVDAEWRYAYKSKGPEYIEPVPIDPPSKCPPRRIAKSI